MSYMAKVTGVKLNSEFERESLRLLRENNLILRSFDEKLLKIALIPVSLIY